MRAAARIEVVLARDGGEPIGWLLARLGPEERALAGPLPTARRRRQFALGRAAARAAARRAGRLAAVSIAHSGRLAVACAWRARPGLAAGIDVERVRPSEVAGSEYAFSARERRLLRGDALAGLAAWTVKEAVFKALRGEERDGPAEIEVLSLDLASGTARVAVRRRLKRRLGRAALRTRVGIVAGPDGDYVLALAVKGDGEVGDAG